MEIRPTRLKKVVGQPFRDDFERKVRAEILLQLVMERERQEASIEGNYRQQRVLDGLLRHTDRDAALKIVEENACRNGIDRQPVRHKTFGGVRD